MSEPKILYSTTGGESLICASPSYVPILLDTGEWSLEPVKPKAPQKPEPATSAKPRQWGDLNTALISALMRGGYVTPDAARKASDEDILAVKGLGKKALVKIRKELG